MSIIFERYQGIIPEFSLFQEMIHEPLPIHIRVNRLKVEPESVVNSLKQRGIHIKRMGGRDRTFYLATGLKSAGNIIEYFLGFIHPQALTSCLASIALSPEKNSYVLDMCAAPGGKTAHMAELMNNTGMIIANELFPNRHIPLGHTLDRLGTLNTVITAYQAQEFPLKEKFDYILADVPCSGEGRFRKIKESKDYMEAKQMVRFTEMQKRIILRGFDLLKEDGEMLYSTCSYNPLENESVVNSLLQKRDACLLPIETGFDYQPGIHGWRNERYDNQLGMAARFYPHFLDSVGFFMARIGRRR